LDTETGIASGRWTRSALVGTVVLATGLSLHIPPAAAATPIGTTFAPTRNCGGVTLLQSLSPGAQYAVPAPGVITSWSVQAAGFNAGIKFKVGRPVSTNVFTIIGESDLKTPTAGVLNTYTDIRVPVQTGDVIGAYYVGPSDCGRTVAIGAGYRFHTRPGDVPVGSSPSWGFASDLQLDIAAVVEPDADGDGFGDETQDQCPTDASKQNECVAPETTITKGPKNKTRQKQATFEFSSSEPGSTFECSLDGKSTFKPCTSPFKVKVKKGRHSFQVQATDQAGNTDGNPATDDWKVKKRKRG
jgi:hypothetical protein